MEREETLVQAVEAIVHPLETPAPVAADERYLDLRQEVGKLSALAGEAVDWRRVVQLGTTLLSEVGKDLLVASYTALALHELHGAGGLAAGLGAITQLLRTQAAGLSPARANARASALEWLLERLKATLGGRTPTAADATPLQAVERALVDLQGACRELLGDRSPGFRSILDVVQSLLLTLPAAAEGSTAPGIAEAPVESTTEAALSSTPDAGATEDNEATNLAEACARWLAPIDPEIPCGADPRGLPIYSELREEIAKASALAADVRTDWPKAWRLADQILREHAKDLQVAAWLALASSHRDGVAGLILGLAAVADLVDAFWPDVHPRRPRPRKDTAAWLVTQAQAILTNTAIESLRPAHLADLEAVSGRLGAVLRERLGDDAPGMRPLRECITQLRADLEARAAAAPVQENAPATPGAPSTSATATPASVIPEPTPPRSTTSAPLTVATTVAAPADIAALDTFLTSTGQALASTARALREAQPADPRAYRLLRAGLWLHLQSAPPSRADGNTGVNGLSERDREQLTELHDGGKWLGLLTRCENLLVNHRLALDLHRLSAAALTGLGTEYAAARLALQAELRALLTRLPALTELRSSDGLPFADPQTQRWIAVEILPRGGAPSGANAEAEEDDDDSFWTDLRERLRQDDRATALAEVQTRLNAASSERRRFLGQLRLAEACDDAGDTRLAAALFTALAETARERGLDRWDPALALRYLGGLARTRHRCGDPVGAREALGRLGQVHAPSAVDLLRELV